MKKKILLLAFILASFTMLAQNPLQQILPNDSTVRKGKLKNGLTYYIRHNSKPEGRAEFYLATNVGAIQETPDQDGLAHFLEHMCFNGTKNFPEKGIINYLQSIGASFGGNVNANTGVEETVYMLTNIPLVRESVIDSCLLILHDYAHYVTNDSLEIDKERPVILDERRQRRNAEWRMHEKSLPYIFGNTKYGKCTLIGLKEHLENFKHQSLINFYKTWYHPDMQAVIVVGDVNVDSVETKIKQIFSQIPAAVNPKKKDIIKIPGNKKPIIGIITDSEASGCNISVLWKRDAAPKELNSTAMGHLINISKYIICAVANERFDEMSAKSDCPFFSASLGIGNICRTCEVTNANVSFKEGNAIPAFKSMYAEIKRIQKYGYSEDEINRAKENILSSYEAAAKSAASRKNGDFVQPLINNFFNSESYMDPEKEYEVTKELLNIVTPQVINKLLPEIASDSNMVVIYTGPQKQGFKTPTKEAIESAIKAVNDSTISAPKFTKVAKELLDTTKLKGSKIIKTEKGLYNSTIWTLGNGLKVILYPTQFKKDEISFSLFKDGGSSLFPNEDLNSLNNRIWGVYLGNTGLSKFSATDLPKMLAGKNVSVAPYIDNLRSGIAGSSSVDDFKTALQLMYLYYTEPRFDTTEFNTGLKSIKSLLPNIIKQPNYKYLKAYFKTVYGDNPRIKIINEDILKKANLNVIEKDYKKLFRDVAGAKVIIVGDFKPENIKGLVETYFGSLPKGHKANKWIDRNINMVKGVVKNDFKTEMKTPQTTVTDIFYAPIKYTKKAALALSAARYIMNMRYVTSLREEEGGTYGANTMGSISREPKEEASFIIQYQCKPNKADKLQELALSDLYKMAKEGPTKEEFDMAIKNIQKSLPEARITNKYWMNNLMDYELYKVDNDKEVSENIKLLTPKDIQNVIKHILDSGNCIEVIMRPTKDTEKE